MGGILEREGTLSEGVMNVGNTCGDGSVVDEEQGHEVVSNHIIPGLEQTSKVIQSNPCSDAGHTGPDPSQAHVSPASSWNLLRRRLHHTPGQLVLVFDCSDREIVAPGVGFLQA